MLFLRFWAEVFARRPFTAPSVEVPPDSRDNRLLVARSSSASTISARLHPVGLHRGPYRHLRQHLKAACSNLVRVDDLPRQQVSPSRL